MYTFTIIVDTDTPNKAGASGFFQIVEIKDFNDEDITDQFDQGTFYTETVLVKHIAKIFSLPIDMIEIINEN